MSATAGEPMRIQKFLSDAGVASRRHAEEMIAEGRVSVNGTVVAGLPAFVDAARDKVTVDGSIVRPQRLEYWLLHKPPGVVCTNNDPARRTRAIDLLPPMREKLNPVGRLDAESSGLLLMTNDGELAQFMTHPRYTISKVYRAEIRGRAEGDLPARMRKGVYLAEGRAQASDVKVVHSSERTSVLMITVREGPNRQIRRMLARLGHAVRKLKRVQVGPLSIKGLPVGAARRLSTSEVAALRRAAEAAAAEPGVHAVRGTRRPRKHEARGFESRGAKPRRRSGARLAGGTGEERRSASDRATPATDRGAGGRSTGRRPAGKPARRGEDGTTRRRVIL